MARKVRLSQDGEVLQSRTKSAIIWTRGFGSDEAVSQARIHAATLGCTVVDLKNEDYYDEIPNPVQDYDVCYTDDEVIARDYESAHIKVVDFKDLDTEPQKDSANQSNNRKQEKTA